VARCRTAGYEVKDDLPLAGYNRTYVYDPFGNRIELMERVTQGDFPAEEFCHSATMPPCVNCNRNKL
jgi:hypothetical protein